MTITPTTPTTTNTTNNKKGALKGSVAAAAGIAVLLGGMGTFALWNVNGAIGTASTSTGNLDATFGTVAWEDVTPGADNAIADITAFRMVPGDVVEGTVDVEVTYQGENLLVDATLDAAAANLPADVTATVNLDGGGDTLRLTGASDNSSTTETIQAVVTLEFDSAATGSKLATVDLTNI